MSRHSRRARALQIFTVAAAASLTLAGCSGNAGSAGASSSASSSSGGGTYTASEVSAGSGAYQVKPIFAVPKSLPKKYSFAFMNPGLSYPFFATWSQGMKAAAKFYGVTLNEADLNFKYDTELSAYQQLAVKQPDVVGSNPMNDATLNAATKDGTKVVLIDNTFKTVPHFGVDDAQVGKLAITVLEPAAKAKLDGAWKGKQLDVLGLSAANCAACDARVNAAFTEAEASLGVAKNHTFRVVPQGTDPTTSSQSTATDFLTAHPHDAVLVVSYGDEPVIGAVNAAKAANRTADVLAVTNGGDAAARAALRNTADKSVLVGSVDYEPYQEGWNWVEASIATAMGKKFGAYSVDRVLTASNVDQYYPNDSK